MSDDPTQDALEQAMLDAGVAYEADPTPENYAAHNAAAVALCDHRASKRSFGGLSVGGDATVGIGE